MQHFFIIAAIACGAMCFSQTQAFSQTQTRGKLGTAGVKVDVLTRGDTKQIVVKRNGQAFAKYAAPTGTRSVLLCCTFGNCSPIGPNTNLICDIVINCPVGWACVPE
jgi:hypothetical protein